ncbi:MAG: AIR synthase family protein [Candidatus Thorarchaeota archaeon]
MESPHLLPGKLPPELLESLVFTYLGRRDPAVLLGPAIGEDASVIRVGDLVLIAATDPITGSVEDVGWLSVHINANDIATFGVKPRWFLTSIMLPAGCSAEDVSRIMSQIDSAAKSLDIAVAGGHTEITEGITNPIIAGFMLGVSEKGEYVTSSGAKPGDAIILTKTAAVEGTSILASEGCDFLTKQLGEIVVREARKLRDQISVVKEGLVAFQTGHVTAMHDPTEGGVAGGLHELCDASGLGFEIDMERIPVHDATRAICEVLSINILELISSGCMLIACKSDHAADVQNAIESVGIQSSIIGHTVTDTNQRLIRTTDGPVQLTRPETDALWEALKKVSRS